MSADKLRISEKLSRLPTINTRNVVDLQGNLKDLSKRNFERLDRSITRYGVLFPLAIWFGPDGTAYTFDGHQRIRYFNTKHPEGVGLPYYEVEADNLNDAKEKLLLFNSQYGEITKDGWDEFMADLGSSDDFIRDLTTFSNFLDFEMPDTSEPENDEDPAASAGAKSRDDGEVITCAIETEHVCPKCGYEF